MNGIESSIYFMLAMMFVGMPGAVIGGIAWDCRRRTRAAALEVEASATDANAPAPMDSPMAAESV